MLDYFESLVDEDFLKDNMTFVSLYIAVYESMTDFVVSNVHDFLCEWAIEDCKEVYKETVKYKEKIKRRVVDDKGNKDITKASFLWFKDNSAVSQKDYEDFLKAKEIRNKFAHELFNVMISGIDKSDIDCFVKMIKLYRKISNWWFVNVEVEFLDSPLFDNAELDKAISLKNVLLDIVMEVLYNGKSEEYKKIIKLYKDGGKDEV